MCVHMRLQLSVFLVLAIRPSSVWEEVPVLRILFFSFFFLFFFSIFPFPQLSILFFLHLNLYLCQGLTLFPETDNLLQVRVLQMPDEGLMGLSRHISIGESSRIPVAQRIMGLAKRGGYIWWAYWKATLMHTFQSYPQDQTSLLRELSSQPLLRPFKCQPQISFMNRNFGTGLLR